MGTIDRQNNPSRDPVAARLERANYRQAEIQAERVLSTLQVIGFVFSFQHLL
jgi:hypothetical protein